MQNREKQFSKQRAPGYHCLEHYSSGGRLLVRLETERTLLIESTVACVQRPVSDRGSAKNMYTMMDGLRNLTCFSSFHLFCGTNWSMPEEETQYHYVASINQTTCPVPRRTPT